MTKPNKPLFKNLKTTNLSISQGTLIPLIKLSNK